MIKTENFEQVEVSSTEQLRAWLETHHTQQASVWVVTFKKHTGERYVSKQQVLDELLCFGWIDGIARKLDDDRTMQLIGPRRVQHWAQSYKDRADKLIVAGRMQASGLTAIAASKRAGLWEYMADVDALELPSDLIAALEAHPRAAAQFAGFPPASTRFVLRWIKLAKTPATRAKRIQTPALLAADNKRIPGS